MDLGRSWVPELSAPGRRTRYCSLIAGSVSLTTSPLPLRPTYSALPSGATAIGKGSEPTAAEWLTAPVVASMVAMLLPLLPALPGIDA